MTTYVLHYALSHCKLCEGLFSCGANFAQLIANPLVELFMVLFSHLLDQLAT